MAHYKKPRRIAAEFMRVVAGPASGGRRIINEARERRFRIRAVIRQHGHITPRRQRLRDKQVICTIAVLPASAVEKDHNRTRLSTHCDRHVDIEYLARIASVRDIWRFPVTTRGNGGVQKLDGTTGGECRSAKTGKTECHDAAFLLCGHKCRTARGCHFYARSTRMDAARRIGLIETLNLESA